MTMNGFLTQEQMEKLSEYASLYLPLSDIAILLECDFFELKSRCTTVGTNEYIAYRKGKLETKLKLHEQEKRLAMTGAPLALENMKNNLMNMEDDEV